MVDYLKMVVTDLDGTLLNSDAKVSDTDLKTLLKLGHHKIIRVAATGRNLHSVKRVITPDFPLDYIAFSSGAGLIDWKTQEIIKTYSIGGETVKQITVMLKELDFDFSVHHPIPENHRFTYFNFGQQNKDFERRIEFYKEFVTKKSELPDKFDDACQLLVIIPKDIDLLNEIRNQFNYIKEIKIIRATSPLDHESIWVEFFNASVSKSAASKWLCEKLNVNQQQTIGIGNDYNDVDLLAFTAKSFLVANAPSEIKDLLTQAKVVASNNESGFTEAVTSIL